jgi:hypothetical protein
MANVLVRSPYYITANVSSAQYYILTITIGGQVVYTIKKTLSNAQIGTPVIYEISELIRDYLEPNYSQNPFMYQSHSVLFYTSIQAYNSSGNPISSPILGGGFGIDGYGYYEDGGNPTTTKGYMQSNDVIYRLGDSDIRIPIDRNNTTSIAYLYKGEIVESEIITPSSNFVFKYIVNARVNAYDSFKDRVMSEGGVYEDNVCISEFLDENETFPVDEIHIGTTDGLKVVKVITIDECRYTPVKVSFINKWGALQDLWFFKKSIQTLNASREQFNRAVINNYGFSVDNIYDTLLHSKKSYNVKSTKKITINTGYVSEQYNAPMQELLQSEQVWMEIDSVITPMTVDANSLTFKTSVNDKLVDYTIDLSYAFDAINNIR